MAEDDALWPQPDRVGRQELEIVIGKFISLVFYTPLWGGGLLINHLYYSLPPSLVGLDIHSYCILLISRFINLVGLDPLLYY